STLVKYPFIGQGLRVESLSFVFKDDAGVAINLTANLSKIVNITVGVNWQIDNDYTLTISTPKYIGYRMAKLDNSTGQLQINYATSLDDKGNWLFKSVDQALLMGAHSGASSIQLSEPLQ